MIATVLAVGDRVQFLDRIVRVQAIIQREDDVKVVVCAAEPPAPVETIPVPGW